MSQVRSSNSSEPDKRFQKSTISSMSKSPSNFQAARTSHSTLKRTSKSSARPSTSNGDSRPSTDDNQRPSTAEAIPRKSTRMERRMHARLNPRWSMESDSSRLADSEDEDMPIAIKTYIDRQLAKSRRADAEMRKNMGLIDETIGVLYDKLMKMEENLAKFKNILKEVETKFKTDVWYLDDVVIELESDMRWVMGKLGVEETGQLKEIVPNLGWKYNPVGGKGVENVPVEQLRNSSLGSSVYDDE